MKRATMIYVAVFLFIGTGVVYAGSCEMPSGKIWKNELGSKMTVQIDSSGSISGTYTTAVGCGAMKPRQLKGFCNGHAVTFSVNWEECASTTSWSGTYENGVLKTLWQLVLAKKPAWDSIAAGSDIFKMKK